MKKTSPNSTKDTDPRDANLLAALRTYQQVQGLTDSTADLKKLANRIGPSDTYFYRYFRNDFRGDLAAFEGKVRDFLESDTDEKVEANAAIIPSDFIIGGMRSFLRQVKAHGFIGVGHGPAGRGKTFAAKLHASQHATTTIYVHANIWCCGRHAITRAIAKAMQLNRPGKGLTLDEALVNRLSGSDRLIIIDNAHRLTEGARRWLADFWDTTHIPIALIGNPEIERQWQRNDQHGSRVGLHRDVTLDLVKGEKSTAKATAVHLLRLHLPEAADIAAVVNDAERSLAEFGACRAVAMRAGLAKNILTGGKITDPAEAWKLAKTQLINAA